MENSQSSYRRLTSLERFGIRLGLTGIRTLLEALGNPHVRYPSILIAGTNGKGSVGAMLNEALSRSGLRTGYYTSPHVVDVRERIRVAGEVISLEEFESSLETVFSAIDHLLDSSQLEEIPTYFETLTATAFYYFSKTKINYAVLEVGLGGRFDATNVVRQELSVITSIDFDHEEFLGRTLAEIAAEKTGILKPDVPVVTGILPGEAAAVIVQAAGEQSCSLKTVELEHLVDLHLENGFPVFEYRPWRQTIRVNLRGRHQAYNAAVALLACDELRQLGYPISRSTVIEAFNEVHWPGRLEIQLGHPPILIDCAHNPMGVRALKSFLDEVGCDRVIALFTAMRDKGIVPMLAAISGKLDMLFLTRVEPLQRCAPMQQLADVAGSCGIRFELEEVPAEALMRAKARADEKGLPLVIFGSIYLVGEIFRILNTPVYGVHPNL